MQTPLVANLKVRWFLGLMWAFISFYWRAPRIIKVTRMASVTCTTYLKAKNTRAEVKHKNTYDGTLTNFKFFPLFSLFCFPVTFQLSHNFVLTSPNTPPSLATSVTRCQMKKWPNCNQKLPKDEPHKFSFLQSHVIKSAQKVLKYLCKFCQEI